MRVKDIRPAPAEIAFKNMKFLITDRPNDQTIHTFIQVSEPELSRYVAGTLFILGTNFNIALPLPDRNWKSTM